MTGPDNEEWITIPEAAQRLNIAERQARRLVSRLPQSERTAEGVRPAKVRWSRENVRQLGGKLSEVSGLSENGPDRDSQQVAPNSEQAGHNSEYGAVLPAIAVPALSEVPPSPAEVPQSDPVTMSGQESEAPDTLNALIEQLRSENAFLRAELTATREGRDMAESELRWLMKMDRDELQRLRSQLALPAHPDPIEEVLAQSRAAKDTTHRNWIQNLLDRLRGRNT